MKKKSIISNICLLLLIIPTYTVSATNTAQPNKTDITLDTFQEQFIHSTVLNNPPQPPIMYTHDFTQFHITIPNNLSTDPVYYKVYWGDGTNSGWIGPYNATEIVSISYTWNEQGTYEIVVLAKNQFGTSLSTVYMYTQSPTFKFFCIKTGYVDIPYQLTLSWENYSYLMIDWGDGTISEWFGPSTIFTIIKIWSTQGIYELRIKGKGPNGEQTNWSDPYIILIKPFNNNPPIAPSINGRHFLQIGKTYEWTFVSSDPEEDSITYYIDWGDECGGAEYHGPYTSGQPAYISHVYYEKNNLTIVAIAIDTYGAESERSTFEVTIAKNKPSMFQYRHSFLVQNILKNIFTI